MREEIEAAALFITKLVNKNLSQSNSTACGSSASSVHSHSSSASTSSSASSSSESPPDLDENPTSALAANNNNNGNQQHDQLDKSEQFKQCLTEALYERFHNHWFPDQPTKGQAYRCIRLNEWDRRDITLQKACLQCGIDYKDLQLPVELTLWVDPEEVTCRFGENKGSHCLVAKFKVGELQDNNFNIDINNIDIEIFQQTTTERMRQPSLHGSPEYSKRQHNRLNNSNGSINNNSSYHQFLHQSNNSHQQQQQPQHNHHHQQAQQQSSPHQPHHRANLGKAAILPAHPGFPNLCDTNGNPIPYYYF